MQFKCGPLHVKMMKVIVEDIDIPFISTGIVYLSEIEYDSFHVWITIRYTGGYGNNIYYGRIFKESDVGRNDMFFRGTSLVVGSEVTFNSLKEFIVADINSIECLTYDDCVQAMRKHYLWEYDGM